MPEAWTAESRGSLSPRAWRITVALGLAVVFALSVVLTVNGGLRWDDFGNLRFSTETGVVDYLLRPVFDHFAPGHRALTLLQYAMGPNNTVAMHLVMSGLQVVALAGFVVAGRHLYGRRPWIVAMAVLVSASTTWVSTQLWFAASLHQVPALAASLWAIVFFLRYRAKGAGGDLVVSVALVVVGLLFVSKALLAVGVIYLVDQLLLRPCRLREVPGRTMQEWPLWFAYVLPVLVYSVLTSDVLDPTQPVSSAGSIVTGIRDGWLERVAPLLIGWDPSAVGADGSERVSLVMLLQVVMAIVVYVSVRRRRDSARAIAVVLAVVVTNGAMTLILRIDAFGADVPLVYRYWLEPVVVAALLLPWGFVKDPDADAPSWLKAPPRALRAVVTATAFFAVAGMLSGISVWRLVDDHSAFDARRWLDDVRAAVASADAPPSVVDDVAPVAWAPIWTLRDMSYLFPEARFTDDPAGQLVRGDQLVEPDFRPTFELVAGELPGNTLVRLDGPWQVDATALCAGQPASVEIFVGPADGRRYGRVTSRGDGTVVYVPRDELGQDLPVREIRQGHGVSTALFPMDLWPPTSFLLQVAPTAGATVCLDTISVGTIANQLPLPVHTGP